MREGGGKGWGFSSVVRGLTMYRAPGSSSRPETTSQSKLRESPLTPSTLPFLTQLALSSSLSFPNPNNRKQENHSCRSQAHITQPGVEAGEVGMGDKEGRPCTWGGGL